MENQYLEEFWDEITKPKTLLVFGNGLDIHCGLNSRFKDFFDYKFKDKHGKLLVNEIKNNLWYLIFTYAFMLDKNYGGKLVPFIDKRDPLWMDVENCIDRVFAEESGMFASSLYNHLLYCFTSKPIQVSNNTGENFGDAENQKALLQNRVIRIRDNFSNNFGNLLLSELNVFENDFTEYLNFELNNKKVNYETNLHNFFDKLDNDYGELIPSFILSFNYTPCLDLAYFKQEEVINIHGTLEENNAIIGIGDYEPGDLPGRSDLKKSKRRIKNDYPPLNMPSNINKIIFYGCSFSIQDTFYYNLIFEKYNLGLENTNCKFFFLYSNYADSELENKKNKNEYYDRCQKIVNNYLIKKKINEDFDRLCTKGKIYFNSI